MKTHNLHLPGIAFREVIVLGIVPTDVPMTYEVCERSIRELAKTYPAIKTRVLTETAFGRSVQALELGTGRRRVLYTAAHHANEWITAPVLLKFAEELAGAAASGGEIRGVPARDILEKTRICLVPMVDPDGVDLVTGGIREGTQPYVLAEKIARDFPDVPFPAGWKANLMGVDLNLQYPAGWLRAREIKFSQGYTRPAPRDYVGRAPLGQPEARALARYTWEVDPALVLALHTQGREIYWQFQDIPVPGARELGEEFARVSGYALAEVPAASGFAGYKDWFIQDFRRPGFTIECGLGENPLPLSQFAEIYRDNLGIFIAGALGQGKEAAGAGAM